MERAISCENKYDNQVLKNHFIRIFNIKLYTTETRETLFKYTTRINGYYRQKVLPCKKFNAFSYMSSSACIFSNQFVSSSDYICPEYNFLCLIGVKL